MIEHITEQLTLFIIEVIDTTGYAGIAFLMALEGSFVPIPSEIILPFSGYLVSQGVFSIWWVAFWGAVGNIIGTLFTYTIARYLGLPFLYRYGKYVLVTRHDIDMAQRLFAKYGTLIIFGSRLLPGIRGFLPIPAGIARMKLPPFVLYVFVGSYLWSLFLTYIGVVIGENWHILEHYFRRADIVIFALLLIGVVWWVNRHIRLLKHETQNMKGEGKNL